MQLFFRALLAIYLGHLLTDFVFQSHHLLEQKRRGKIASYGLHGLIHYLSTIAVLGFVSHGSLLSLRTHLVVAALSLVHLLIDFGKIKLAADYSAREGARAYITDQIVHFLTVVFAAWLLTPAVPFGELGALVQNARSIPNRFLAVPVIYAAVIFGGGYLIRSLVSSLAANVGSHSSERAGEQLQNAGLYIGWLERFLVVTALLVQSPATVGLILTAKSIARYPEFKTERFAEYFLIGTLLSISMALLAGAVLSKLLFGHVRVSG